MENQQEFNSINQKYSERKERWRLEGLWWAVVLIWAGLVFFADSLDLVPHIGAAEAWSWIFLGAGVFGLLGAAYRLTSANVPNPTTWDWIWSSFCTIIGLGGFTTLNIAWPLILILAGVIILVSVLWRRN